MAFKLCKCGELYVVGSRCKICYPKKIIKVGAYRVVKKKVVVPKIATASAIRKKTYHRNLSKDKMKDYFLSKGVTMIKEKVNKKNKEELGL